MKVKDYQNEHQFNRAYLRDNLPKVKEGTCVINFDEYDYIGTQCDAIYINSNAANYFDSFGIDHNSKETKNFIGNYIIASIYWKHIYNSTMRRQFCIGFTDFTLNNKRLVDFTNLFSSNNFSKKL